MAKRAQVQPAWLDDLLLMWSRRFDVKLGFASICPMFRERVAQPARSFEPTGYCDADFNQLEAALGRLNDRHKLVLVMYYKPWRRKDAEAMLLAKFGQVTDRTWRNWLQEAAACLVADMERQKEAA
jgi:hypothetical protein